MRHKLGFKAFSLLLILCFLLTSCSTGAVQGISQTTAPSTTESTELPQTGVSPSASSSPDDNSIEYGTLQVIFIDVGQADCALILTDEHAMLIDAGNIGQGNLILSYLAEHDVNSLDYLVATHPHADHIGSMDDVIRAMDKVETLLMPDVIHTTKVFERLLDAIEEKEMVVTVPQPGDTFNLGMARVQVIAPNSGSYSDLNDYSIVLRIEFGDTAILFAGDAEYTSENEQLSSGFNISSDVLKVGHHGSRSSTSKKYLEAVFPSYAVISCGTDNSYGHPNEETLSRLSDHGVTVYRTDMDGTVAMTTDGREITIDTG